MWELNLKNISFVVFSNKPIQILHDSAIFLRSHAFIFSFLDLSDSVSLAPKERDLILFVLSAFFLFIFASTYVDPTHSLDKRLTYECHKTHA